LFTNRLIVRINGKPSYITKRQDSIKTRRLTYGKNISFKLKLAPGLHKVKLNRKKHTVFISTEK